MIRACILAAALALTATGAAADPADPADPDHSGGGGILSEVKLGILQHDIEFLPVSREDGQAVNAEILFGSPGFLDAIWSPRPHLGASVSLQGRTDHIYAGLTWTFRPIDEGAFAPLWLSAFGGGALHDGESDTRNPVRKSLGSPALFRLGGEIGWDVTRRMNVSIYYSHISNAFIANPNEGLEQAGLRLGWRF